jgi:hypothetical protein
MKRWNLFDKFGRGPPQPYPLKIKIAMGLTFNKKKVLEGKNLFGQIIWEDKMQHITCSELNRTHPT